MTYTQFQILMLFWNMSLVDTFSILKICLNCGSQYMSIVGTAAVGNSSDLGIKTLLEPVFGLGTSYQFVRAAATAVERRQRIATLASFLVASAASITTDPLKYGAMNLNAINWVSPQVDYSQNTQPLKALYLDQNVENDTQSVNLIELKTGSGTVLRVRKHQNQTSEASKSALKVRGGFRFDVVSIIDRSSRLEEYAKDVNEKYPAEMQKLRDDLGSGHFKSGHGSRKMAGSKTIYYMRSGQKVRLYYRYSKSEERTIEIVAETSKDNQPKTIKLLKKMYK